MATTGVMMREDQASNRTSPGGRIRRSGTGRRSRIGAVRPRSPLGPLGIAVQRG